MLEGSVFQDFGEIEVFGFRVAQVPSGKYFLMAFIFIK